MRLITAHGHKHTVTAHSHSIRSQHAVAEAATSAILHTACRFRTGIYGRDGEGTVLTLHNQHGCHNQQG